MAYSLVGSEGAAVQSASGSGISTLAWGTGQSRTAGNLLTLQVVAQRSSSAASLPATPTGWTLLKSQAAAARATSGIYIKIATGGDAAPTLAAVTSTVLSAKLNEFSAGGALTTAVADKTGGANGTTTSPLVATFTAADAQAGDLVLWASAVTYSTAGTGSITPTPNNGATAHETSNNGTSSVNHYEFGWGITTGNSAADSISVAFTTTSASDSVVAGASVAPYVPPPPGVSWVQGTGANGGGATVPAPAYGTNLTPGNWMAAWVVVDVNPTVSTTPATTAVVASTGETFTKLWDSGAQNITVTNGSNVWNVSLWVAQVAGGAGAKPTITPTIANAASSSGFGIIIGELYESTGATALALDGTPAAAFPTGNYSSVTTPAFSDTTTAGMLWALYADWGLNNAATNNGSGYTTTTDVIPNSNTQEYLLTKTASGGVETAVTFTFPSGNTGNPGLAIMGSIIAGSSVTTVNGTATATVSVSSTANGVATGAGSGAATANVTASETANGTVGRFGAATALAQVSVVATAPRFLTSVSSNGRYLLDQFGNPYMVNGDTPWNVAWASNATDQETYLADRASYGCNCVMVDLIGNNQMHGNANGANWNGETPGTLGSTYTPNSTYWGRIDTFFQLCQKYGVTVWAMPLDSYSATSGNYFASITTAQATAFGTFLGNRYKNFPGIVWMIGNDYDADGPTGGAQNAAPATGVYTAMLAAISAAGDTHLTTSELAYYESNSSDGAATWSYMKINGAYCYHPTYEGVLRARNATPTSPVVMIEAVYDQATTSYPDTALDMRKVCLWPMTSGATGQFYGNDYWWPQPAGWLTALDTTNWVVRARLMNLFAGLTGWQNLQPDTASQLVTAGRQSQWTSGPSAGSITPYTNDATYGNYVTAAYTPDGTLGVIYNPTSATLTLSATVLGGSPSIKRVDPVSGAQTALSWTTSLTSPGNNSGGDPDWLYIIQAGVVTISGTATASIQVSSSDVGVVSKLGSATALASVSETANGLASASGTAIALTKVSETANGVVTQLASLASLEQVSSSDSGLVSVLGSASALLQVSEIASGLASAAGSVTSQVKVLSTVAGVISQLGTINPLVLASSTANGVAASGSSGTVLVQAGSVISGIVSKLGTSNSLIIASSLDNGILGLNGIVNALVQESSVVSAGPVATGATSSLIVVSSTGTGIAGPVGSVSPIVRASAALVGFLTSLGSATAIEIVSSSASGLSIGPILGMANATVKATIIATGFQNNYAVFTALVIASSTDRESQHPNLVFFIDFEAGPVLSAWKAGEPLAIWQAGEVKSVWKTGEPL